MPELSQLSRDTTLLRAFDHLREGGTLGLIATNTIAQGDTLSTGLDVIVGEGGNIYWADNNRPWPGQAAVSVNVVHICEGTMQPPYILDDRRVKHISKMLDPRRVSGDPYKLLANEEKGHMGTNVVGMGFVLSPEEAEALIEQNPRNKDVLYPFLNGQDLNSRPDQSPSRWIINFFDWPLARDAKGDWEPANEKQKRDWLRKGHVPSDYPWPVAWDYPDCMRIVREIVYPDRASKKGRYARIWWQYGRRQELLYKAIAPLRRTLVAALTSKYLSFAFVPTEWVYSHACGIFAFDTADMFSVLQSSLHESWVRGYASTLETRLRYTPRDVFETFSFPNPTSEQLETLDRFGETYHEHRRQVMLERQEGLTDTYNRFHDPDETAADIARLRELHVEMDRAVAAAYGWEGLVLGHGFHETPQGVRFTIDQDVRWEVLDRLLELNHARHAEEIRAGLHGKKKGSGGTSQADERQMELL